MGSVIVALVGPMKHPFTTNPMDRDSVGFTRAMVASTGDVAGSTLHAVFTTVNGIITKLHVVVTTVNDAMTKVDQDLSTQDH